MKIVNQQVTIAFCDVATPPATQCRGVFWCLQLVLAVLGVEYFYGVTCSY
jgi:hypothetical protein